MGNSCFCSNINFIKDVKLNVCFNKQTINNKSDKILIKDEDKVNTNEKQKNKKQTKNKMNEILNYFNEGEKEIMNNYKKKEKAKNISTKKRLDHTNINQNDNKYELILKRLLEQQNIKKVGPKRRKTIRNEEGEKIKETVKNLLAENKEDILKNKNKNEEDQNNSLLIKKEFNKKGRFSVSFDRNTTFMNSLNNMKKKIFQEQYLKNRNTMYEVIVESNADLENNQNSNISK